MALLNFQKAIELDKLYEVEIGSNAGTEQLRQSLFIKGGTVDVYGSNSATEPTSYSDMELREQDTDLKGVIPFDTIPRYIAVKENTATVTELILSGVGCKELGTVS